MSDELLRKLRTLEDEYSGQPPVVQRADLQEINRIRTRLGMRLVDSRLCEIGVAAVAPVEPPPTAPPVRDHSQAQAIYEAYLKKKEELEPHRAYAELVARATTGPGQTPVRPLATMGTGGGPLLCDQCRKPMVLEGGQFHKVAADAAWRQNPSDNWTSWIFGGMVVEIKTNGTLRIYHGYPGRGSRHCCNVASQNEEKAQAEFVSENSPEKYHLLLAFLEDQHPEMTERERRDLVNEVLNTMYEYDPGIGINRPGGEHCDTREKRETL